MYPALHAAICVLLVRITDSDLRISIHPKRADVGETNDVTIRCSLNLRQTKTDRVYSIMLKRRNTTVAVLLTNGVELPDKHYAVDGTLSTSRPGSVYLQLTLSNVTCYDRGDYSCRMAVRRSYKNLQLGPVVTSFIVIGRTTSVAMSTSPRKSIYAVGEPVQFKCAALTKSVINDWSWYLSSPPTGVTESCSYNESECLYNCTSSVLHFISSKDSRLLSKCGYKGNFRGIKLNVTTIPLTDTSLEPKDSPTFTPNTSQAVSKAKTKDRVTYTTEKVTPKYHSSQNIDEENVGQRTILIYSFISVICVIFFFIFIYLFATDRCMCRKLCLQRRNTNKSNISNSYHAQGQPCRQQHRILIVPASRCPHVPVRCRYHPRESSYLIQPNEDGHTSPVVRNDQQHMQFRAENIYEDVGQPNDSEGNNIAGTESHSVSYCAQRHSEIDHLSSHSNNVTNEIK